MANKKGSINRNSLNPAEVLRDGMDEATPDTRYKFPKGKTQGKGKKGGKNGPKGKR